MKYVASKNQKAFMTDLKPVYRASSKEAAEKALDELENKWGDTYPIVIKSWRRSGCIYPRILNILNRYEKLFIPPMRSKRFTVNSVN